MISQYKNRVESFIHRVIYTLPTQMKANPIRIQVQQQINSKEIKQFRNSYEKQKNITDQVFKFRDTVDWQSILTPLQRIDRQSTQQQKLEYLNKLEIPNCLMNRDLASQEPYQPIKQVKFRTRQKQKQIHSMRFHYLPTESNLTNLKNSNRNSNKLNERYSHSRNNSFSQCSKYKQQFNKSIKIENKIVNNRIQKNLSVRQKHEKEKVAVQSNVIGIKKSTGNDNISQSKNDWSEVQFTVGNKKEQKLHFKAAIQMANKKNNIPIKTILQNCKIFRFKQKQKLQENVQKSE